jgi:poly-gamma-glutamate synthesis protein (capsule biosynthesis protein)
MRTDHYLRSKPPRPPKSGRRFVGPAILGGAFLLVAAVGVNALTSGAGAAATTTPKPTVAAVASPSTSAPGVSPSTVAPSPSDTDTSASPTPGPSATPVPTEIADVAIVPVTNFRSGQSRVGFADVDKLEQGTGTYEALTLVASDADAILTAIHADRAALGDRLKTVDDATALASDLANHRDRLAFLRVSDVTPAVRALGWGGRELFGTTHVPAAQWPLTAKLAVAEGSTADPTPLWTMIAGGDILLDRGVSLAIGAHGRDFLFDGKEAEITSRYCCSSFGWELPRTRRVAGPDSMRDYLQSADVTIANFENPAPNQPRFHASGTVFSADPKHLKALKNAGIDWVSIANNHIGDAGRQGIVQTIANLRKNGIKAAGAGKDIDAARAPSFIDVGDIKVALFGYDTIARYYKADGDTPGSVQMSKTGMKADIRKARAAGADVVIVMPHWGTEYDPTPFPGQRDLAHAAIDAGADLVIGNHAHWAGAMEVYEGKPIWYALGNFVFDQTWSEPTMEGITLELTFRGKALVQARLHPHVILDKAQPNFLDPLGDGKVVLSQVFGASKGLLPW